MDSYLHYEVKVVLRNKTAREGFVRIPLWVDREVVRCRVGSKEVSNMWFDNRLRFTGLKPGEVLTIQFPMVERTEEWTIPRVAGKRSGTAGVHVQVQGEHAHGDLTAAD